MGENKKRNIQLEELNEGETENGNEINGTENITQTTANGGISEQKEEDANIIYEKTDRKDEELIKEVEENVKNPDRDSVIN